MSFNGLSIASSALQAFQSVENVISDNISNVNTPGASEESALLTEKAPIAGVPGMATMVTPGTIGQGVTVSSIQRIHDNALDALYRGAYSSQNYYSEISTGLTTLQQSVNEPSGGISTAYSNFQTAVSQLASVNTNASNNTANRANVLQTAQALTTAINQDANQIQAQSQTTETTAANMVNSINGVLDQIATLNGEIREATAAGESPNTYLDQRDEAIDQLSQYVPTTTVNEPNGSTLVTVNGRAVVDDTVAYHFAAPIEVSGSNGITQLEIYQVNDPNPSNPNPVPLGSGELGGLVDLYNNYLANYTSGLNSFASGLSQQFNSVNESGYDQNGQQGVALFSSTNVGGAVQAGSIKVNLVSPAQVAIALASTVGGGNTQAMNASNTQVTTSSAFNNDSVFNNPAPAAGLTGTLTITSDGVTSTYNYNTSGTDSTLNGFIANFNKQQIGVTASYSTTSQQIIFARDPSNESLAFQAKAGYAPEPQFTIADSGGAAGTQPAAGTVATGLLDVMGAGKINGVVQNASNAYSSSDNSNASQMNSLFSASVGVPAVSTTATGAIATGQQTITPVGGLGNIAVGATLTIGAGTAAQENVTVTAIDSMAVPPTFTATFANAHAAGVTIQAAPTQTLSSYYTNYISGIGYDASGANSGLATQTSLTNDINTRRSSTDGINLDQETQQLVQYQTAYQAVARTFSTLDSMLQSVISQLIP